MATAAVQEANDGIISQPDAIQQILLDLKRSQTFVTVSAGGKQLSSSLLEVDLKAGHFIFEGGGESLGSGKLLFSASLRGVSVRFSSAGASETTFEGNPALRASFPQDVQYMQRRESFRTPFPAPYTCTLKLNPNKSVTLELRDISIGGIGLQSPTVTKEQLDINTLADASLDFEKLGKINVTVVVTSYRKGDNNGKPIYLFGCRFSKLDRTTESSIQRLVFQLDQMNRSRKDDD